MNVKRGQIYYVDFDRTATRSTEKYRPAVVIQNDAGNTHSPYTIVAVIRHLSGKSLPVLVEISQGEGGLRKRSVVDCGHLHTVHLDELQEYSGSLPNHRMAQVDKALAISLGLRFR
jgi:mRNA interferase MazF